MGFFDFLKSKNDSSTDSLVELCLAILQSATELTDKSKELWKSNNISESEAKTIEFTILSEFTCFFLAMTDRIAFSFLKNKRKNEVMDQLSSSIRDIVINSYFKEWDEKIKDNLKNSFLDGYNDSQLRYSKAFDLIEKSEPFTGNGSLSILGREIAEINMSAQNPEIIMRTIELTGASFSKMNLKFLVENLQNN